MDRILIGALSAATYADRRENCTRTWFPTARRWLAGAYFLIGGFEETGECGDVLQLAVPDVYPTLPQKTRAFCEWALRRQDWTHLFKCDDDTAISIARLGCLDLRRVDYLGAEWQEGVGYGSGGAGYLLSRKAAAIVAADVNACTGAEDQLVGEALRRRGVKFSISDRFIPWGSMAHRPSPENDKITVHAVGRDVFEAVHEIDRAAGLL